MSIHVVTLLQGPMNNVTSIHPVLKTKYPMTMVKRDEVNSSYMPYRLWKKLWHNCKCYNLTFSEKLSVTNARIMSIRYSLQA